MNKKNIKKSVIKQYSQLLIPYCEYRTSGRAALCLQVAYIEGEESLPRDHRLDVVIDARRASKSAVEQTSFQGRICQVGISNSIGRTGLLP